MSKLFVTVLCLGALQGLTVSQSLAADAAAGKGATGPAVYAERDPRLKWEVVRSPEKMTANPEGVSFRVVLPAAVEGTDLVLRGELENTTGKPAVVYLSSPSFHLGPRYENGLDWQPACPDPACAPQPPAPPLPMRLTVPAHAVVQFSAHHDLRTLKYRGSPTVRFDWHFGFLKTPAAQGTFSVPLPARP